MQEVVKHKWWFTKLIKRQMVINMNEMRFDTNEELLEFIINNHGGKLHISPSFGCWIVKKLNEEEK